jgi:lactose/L-arabinose transport system substrate-binding protein
MEEKKMKKINRRDFLRLAAFSAAGATLASCAPVQTPTAAPVQPAAPTATTAPTQPAAPTATTAAAQPAAPTATTAAAAPAEASLMTQKAAGQSITVWGWDKPEFNKVVEDYIKQSAGVTINGQTYGGDDEWKKITTSAAAGVGLPDAFKSGTYNVPQLVEMGAVIDLTPLVAPYKDLLPDVAWQMSTYNGKIYTVPANSPASGFFWRYDVCDKYGIDPDSINTWDDFMAAGLKVQQDSGGKNHFMYTPATGPHGMIFTAIQQENRAQVLTNDLKVAIGPDSQPWKDTLDLNKKLLDAKFSIVMDEWAEPWYQAMKDGSVACYPIGTWFVETIIQQAPDTKGMWYFTPFAAVKAGGDRYTNSGSASCFISSQTQKIDASWEWCKAWCLDPHGTLDLGLETLGISCISNAALDNSYVKAPHPYFAKNQAYWLAATEAFTKSTYVPPATKLDGDATTIFNTEIEKFWKGSVSEADFLTNVANQLHTQLKI